PAPHVSESTRPARQLAGDRALERDTHIHRCPHFPAPCRQNEQRGTRSVLFLPSSWGKDGGNRKRTRAIPTSLYSSSTALPNRSPASMRAIAVCTSSSGYVASITALSLPLNSSRITRT